jgi:hypothetical protein
MEGLKCNNWGEMLVTNTIFGRWELAVADNVYIRYGNGSNIGSQTFKVLTIPRLRKKIPVFPLTCSKILGLVGRKKILFFKIFLDGFYRGHILTLTVLVQKWQKKTFRIGTKN